MDPSQELQKSMSELMREMNPKQLKKAIKGAYRRVGKGAREIALYHLHKSGIDVQGDRTDFDKGLRVFVYGRGGGFMITTKARAANSRTGKGEKGMHKNRRGQKKPILMWAADGTKDRYRKTGRKVLKGNWKWWARQGGSRPRYVWERTRKTGKMPDYGFIDKATPEASRYVEDELGKELQKSVEKVAKKAGFI